MNDTKQQDIISDNIQLGFSAVSPATQIRSPNWYQPSPVPSSVSTLPNSVYSTTDIVPKSYTHRSLDVLFKISQGIF